MREKCIDAEQRKEEAMKPFITETTGEKAENGRCLCQVFK